MNANNLGWIVSAMTALAAAGGLAGPAHAQNMAAPAGSAGEWRLESADGKRKCVLTLRTTAGQNGAKALGAPATCRRSLRALAGAAGWMEPGGERIDLTDASGAPILSFMKRDGVLAAVGSDAETYFLLRAGETAPRGATPGFQPVAPAAAGGVMTERGMTAAGMTGGGAASAAMGRASAAPPATPAPPAAAPPKAAEIAGRYAILRDVGRETGCMLTLDQTPRGSGARAMLAPACRDNGVVIFEPVAWAMVGGKLALTARKGHRAHFIFTQDGSWQKDPKEGGKPLGLRKM